MKEALMEAYEQTSISETKVTDLKGLLVLINTNQVPEDYDSDNYINIIENLDVPEIDLLTYTITTHENAQSEWVIKLALAILNRAIYFIPFDETTSFPHRLIKPMIKLAYVTDPRVKQSPFWPKFEQFLGSDKIKQLPSINLKNTFNAIKSVSVQMNRRYQEKVLENILKWSLPMISQLKQINEFRSVKMLIYQYLVSPQPNITLLADLLFILYDQYLKQKVNVNMLDIALALIHHFKSKNIEVDEAILKQVSQIVAHDDDWLVAHAEVCSICFYSLKLGFIHKIPKQALHSFHNMQFSRQILHSVFIYLFACILPESEYWNIDISHRKALLMIETLPLEMDLVRGILRDEQTLMRAQTHLNI